METITPSNHPKLFSGGPFLLSLGAKQQQGFFSAGMSIFPPSCLQQGLSSLKLLNVPEWPFPAQSQQERSSATRKSALLKQCFRSQWALGQLDFSNFHPSSSRKSTENPQHCSLAQLYFYHYYRNLKCRCNTFGRCNRVLINKLTLSGWIKSLQVLQSSSHLPFILMVMNSI